MRIVFIGTVKFSLRALDRLLQNGENVVGVVTKESSTFNADYANLTPLCEANEIPYHYTKNVNSEETVNAIRTWNPDIIFCLGWSELIKKELLTLPPRGVVGYHPSLLPKNRGRHPIIWALVLGLNKSGSSFFFMDEGADSGDLISQASFDITLMDTAETLYTKFTEKALQQLDEFVPKLRENTLVPQKQDHRKASYWRKRGMKDGEIDFRMSTMAIYNLVRALTKPYVGAHVMYKGEPIIVWEAEVLAFDQQHIEPGRVLEIRDHNSIVVKTYDGAICLVNHEFKDLPEINTYL